jgi:hypothetical protein
LTLHKECGKISLVSLSDNLRLQGVAEKLKTKIKRKEKTK